MKKTLILAVCTAILVISSCVSAAESTSQTPAKTETASKAGGSILYVARIEGDEIKDHDKVVISHLEKLGYTVVPMAAKPLTGEETKDYDFVFLSETNASNRVKSKFVFSEQPILSCENYVGDEMGFTGAMGEVDNGKKEFMYSEVKIVKPGHPLAAGLSGLVKVYAEEGTMGFGKPGGDVVVVATAPDDPDAAFIYAYEKGAKNMLGEVVPARRVMFFLFEGMENIVTDDGWKLFDAAVTWTYTK
ncbi:MAG: hypothetical protein JW904_08540 [Spirochaetales bacterium]|nr:hypothetical protein [Spirochaetales bacterium]